MPVFNTASGRVPSSWRIRTALALALALATTTLGPNVFATERASVHASLDAPDPSRMMGDWYIVAQKAGWLERQLAEPRVRMIQGGSNAYTVTVSFRGPLGEARWAMTMDAWFEDPGTNRQWRERMLGVFVNRSEIRAIGDDYLIVGSASGTDLWLLSRASEPSTRAIAAFARESEVTGNTLDEFRWPYRAQ